MENDNSVNCTVVVSDGVVEDGEGRGGEGRGERTGEGRGGGPLKFRECGSMRLGNYANAEPFRKRENAR